MVVIQIHLESELIEKKKREKKKKRKDVDPRVRKSKMEEGV